MTQTRAGDPLAGHPEHGGDVGPGEVLCEELVDHAAGRAAASRCASSASLRWRAWVVPTPSTRMTHHLPSRVAVAVEASCCGVTG